MGQQEIKDLLKKIKKKEPDKWLKTNEIADMTGVGTSSATNSLRRLRGDREVAYRFNEYYRGGYEYQHREMREE